MVKTVTITRNGQSVECWGSWHDDSNAACTFDDESFDGIWADGADNWTQVVEELTAYAKRHLTTLIELSAI